MCLGQQLDVLSGKKYTEVRGQVEVRSQRRGRAANLLQLLLQTEPLLRLQLQGERLLRVCSLLRLLPQERQLLLHCLQSCDWSFSGLLLEAPPPAEQQRMSTKQEPITRV